MSTCRSPRCIIDPDNVASIRVALKCDYRDKGRIAGSDTALILKEREKAV